MTRRSRKTRTTYGVRALRSERGYAVQSLASRRLLELPLVRQPSIQFAQLRLRQVHQQLREIQLRINLVPAAGDRKSTRLNSSHPSISYAVFCLKKKKKEEISQNYESDDDLKY